METPYPPNGAKLCGYQDCFPGKGTRSWAHAALRLELFSKQISLSFFFFQRVFFTYFNLSQNALAKSTKKCCTVKLKSGASVGWGTQLGFFWQLEKGPGGWWGRHPAACHPQVLTGWGSILGSAAPGEWRWKKLQKIIKGHEYAKKFAVFFFFLSLICLFSEPAREVMTAVSFWIPNYKKWKWGVRLGRGCLEEGYESGYEVG